MAAVNLLLVGRTGNGKSSTGNSILGRKEFQPRGPSCSVSYIIKKGMTTLGDKTVTVVDGPGLGDTTTDVTENGQSMIELVQEALSLISNKLHVLILVLKYGVRFTTQERGAVKMIKTILGEDVLRNYGIIMMSYGDSFKLDTEDENTPFETWCTQQTGDVQILFNECGNRYVLFNNKSTDPTELMNQNEQLMKMVTDITMNRQPYSEDDFKKAEYGRKKLLVMGKLPELDSTTETIINNLTKQLEQLRTENSHTYARNIQELTMMSGKLENLIEFLELEDQNTGSIGNLLAKINIIKSRVTTMIDLQTLKLKNADDGRAQPVGKTRTPLPRSTRANFLQREIELVGFAFRRCSEIVRLPLWLNFERIKSDPFNSRNFFVYLVGLSFFGFICHKIYSRRVAGKLLKI